MVDPSNGWEAVAARLIAERSSIGAATVREWARTLPGGARVLDLGCGAGVPISAALVEEGCVVSGIDASPTLAAAFRERFPQAEVACEPAEDSAFFGRTYHGIVAIGLMFLLQPQTQRALIHRVAAALEPRGRFLFMAPLQQAAWLDIMTGRRSVSLGDAEYRRVLATAGLTIVGERVDEGENHYYDTGRAADGGVPRRMVDTRRLNRRRHDRRRHARSRRRLARSLRPEA